MKVLNVTENGYGKTTPASDFNVQGRGGKGVKIHQITEKTGKLVGVCMVNDLEEFMIISSEGVIIRLRVKDISTFNRVSQGVKLINMTENISVVGVTKIHEDDVSNAEEKFTENIEANIPSDFDTEEDE